MNKRVLKKPFIIAISIAIIIAISILVFILLRNKEKTDRDNDNTSSNTTITTSTKSNSQENSKTSTSINSSSNQSNSTITSSQSVIITQLDKVLKSDCEKFDPEYPDGKLSVSKAPFTYNNVLTLQPISTSYDIKCNITVDPNTGSLTVKFKDSTGVFDAYVYDNDSDALGYGGAPVFASFKNIFDSGSDYNMSYDLVYGDVVGIFHPEVFSIVMKVEKILKYSDGYVYINADFTVYDGNEDESFRQFLIDNALKGNDDILGPIIYPEVASQKIKNHYFIDVKALPAKENAVYNRGLNILKALGMKQ